MTSTYQLRQAERSELQAEIRETSERIEQLFQYLNRLIARQVQNGSVQGV